MRWLVVLGIALDWWADGAMTSPVGAWLPFAVIAGVLILPDVAGFAVGGLRVDMREARREIAQLRQDVNAQARASSASTLAVGDSAIAALFQQLAPAARELRNAQATGAPARWNPAPVDTPPEQGIPS